jgi:hypothetical protein
VIEAAQRDYTMEAYYVGDSPVTMGVDVASVRKLHVRISEHLPDGRKRALFIGEVLDFAKLAELVERFGVWMCAVDGQPERRQAQAFAESFPGRVYLVSYAGATTVDPISVNEDARHVTVSRVDLIDDALALLRQQRNLLPRDLPRDYVSHLQAVIRSVDRTELGRVRPVYRSVGSDDYVHAEVYDVVATKLLVYRDVLESLCETEYLTIDDVVPDIERSRLSAGDDCYYHPGPGFDPDLGVDFAEDMR